MRFAYCLSAISALILTSCAATKIVRKPEVNAVKKVAVVSLFAADEVIYKHGNEKYDTWSWETKERVAKMAHQAFSEELKKLGWESISVDRIVNSSVYKTEFGKTEAKKDANLLEKGAALAQQAANRQWFTVPNMTPIEWNKENTDRDVASFDLGSFSLKKEKALPERLKTVANDLGADASLVIQLDYCYGDGTSIAGNGEAYILGQASMYGVDKRGEMVIALPPIKNRCQTEEYAGKSAHSTSIVGGKLVFSDRTNQDKLVTMFYEATKNTARSVAKALDKAINGEG